jgi:hypothetical protein
MLLYLEICIKNLTIKTFVINDLQKTLKNSIKKIWKVGNKVGILHSQTTGKEL